MRETFPRHGDRLIAEGSTLGPYEVTGRLGEGGMGAVLRARDTRLGREVALKLLPAEFARDPARLARFRQEALALATLNHPNVGSIYGFEETASGEKIAFSMIANHFTAPSARIDAVVEKALAAVAEDRR